MATTKVRIVENGVPVIGASVVVGEITQVPFLSDGNGEVVKTVPADFAVFCNIAVSVGGTLRGNYGPSLIAAGTTYTIDITQTAPL